MSETTIFPIRDRVVIEPVSDDSRVHSPNKFIVSPGAIDKMKRGRVLAVGEGFLAQNGTPVGLAVKVGDVVLYEEQSARPVHSYGKQYAILREQEVLAVERASKQA